MNGGWQQDNRDVHPELDLAIASPGEFNLIMQDLGDDFGGLLGLGPNSPIGNTGGASAAAAAAAAAAADQDSNGGRETQSDQSQRTAARRPNRKRHERDQIVELEAAFRRNRHPDEQQRAELGRRIGISPPQVKFWFQNRRSAQRSQDNKQELKELREAHDALQAERQALMSATARATQNNTTCLTCRSGAPADQDLLCENMRLRENLRRASDFLKKLSAGRADEAVAPVVATPRGSHGPAAAAAANHNVGAGKGKALATDQAPPSHRAATGPVLMPGDDDDGFASSERDTKDMLINIAAQASNEFDLLINSQVWVPTPDGEAEMLNFQSYIDTMFPSIFGPYRMGRHVDGSRKTGDVMCAADTLVGVLMDAASWLGMFPGIVASANARHIATPITTSRHGMVIMIDAELRVLSPRVPVRKIKFLRHCRQVEPAGTWAVVDVSVDGILGQDGGRTGRLLPSGCLIQKRSNTSCKVTWIVNMEYEVAGILEEYHPFLRSGQALGACRWIACLQRQCAYLAIVHSHVNNGDKTRDGKMSIFDVARQMTMSFYEVVRGPWSRPWRRLGEWSSVCGVGVESFKVLARVVTFAVGNNGGDVLNVMAPVWLPGVPPQQVFDYLCDENRRGEWDSLANGAPVLREGYFPTGQLPGNAVSVLGTINASDGTPSGKVILQEACADTSCMVLAYTIMDEQSMQHAMNNGGPASLSLLPSGVVILPDGASPASAACSSSTAVTHSGAAGSFVSVMYQTLLSGQPPEGPSYETIDNAGNLLCRVIRKIKDAVHANSVVSA